MNIFLQVAVLACGLTLSAGAARASEPRNVTLEEAKMRVPPEARKLIEHFGMENIPHEGPWFVQTHKSDELIEGKLAERYAGKRYAYTAIYAILTADDFSAMHRLAADEMWHFYGGSPSRVLLLYPDGRGEVKIMGGNVSAGEEPQFMVPRGTWMGARPIGDPANAYTLGGNTLSPGFEYADYEAGYRDELTALYPQFTKEIAELTRPDSLARPKATGTPVALAPPVALTELVGRAAPQKSDAISVARFTLQAGATMPRMMTKNGHEVMIVTAGRGTVTVGERAQDVSQGSVVYLPPQIPHGISAATRLEFYVAVAPAWREADTTVLGD